MTNLRAALEALITAADNLGDAANSGMCDEAIAQARAALAKTEPRS